MDNTFKVAFKKLLYHEGGFSDDPLDRGGATKYGITEKVAREHGYTGDMKDLPLSLAEEIYYNGIYYKKQNFHKIESPEIAHRVFDIAVNQGPGTACRFLQRAINYHRQEELTVDGIIGPLSLKTLNSHNNPDRIHNTLVLLQGNRYLSIVENDSTQKRFIGGWLNRLDFI